MVAVAFASASGAGGAKLTLRQVSEVLVKAAPGQPTDFSRDDLSFLDLSDLDFKQAKLIGANLYGANLSDDNQSGADLSETNLDHAVITRTNFANLTNASMYDGATFCHSLKIYRAVSYVMLTTSRIVPHRTIRPFREA
jgi:uncharacterized protein YjbI with pentapeptide repeats